MTVATLILCTDGAGFFSPTYPVSGSFHVVPMVLDLDTAILIVNRVDDSFIRVPFIAFLFLGSVEIPVLLS